MNKVLTKEQRDDIERLYLEGVLSYKSLADKYGVSIGTIQNVIINAGLRGNRNNIPVDVKEQVVSVYNSKRCTVNQIATKYGVSAPSVYKWVKMDSLGEDLCSQPHGKLNKAVIDNIIYDYTENMIGTRKLASKYGVTSAAIAYVLKSAGVYEGKEGGAVRKIKLTEDVKQKILHDYNCQGLSMLELSSKYDVTGSSIRKVLREFGITNPFGKGNGVHKSSLKYTLSDSVIADHNTGLYTHKNLAEKYKVSTRTISRILASAGLKAIGSVPRTPSDVVAQVRDGVLASLAEGKDVYEVAELHKIPVDTVKRIAGGGKESEDSVTETPVGMGAGVEDKVVSLHEGGRKMTEIAEEIGLTAYTVRKVLVEHGLDTKMVHVEKPSGTKSDRLREAVLADHKAGMDVKSLAGRHGLSVPTVRKLVGVEPKVSKSERVRDDVLAAHNDGLGAADIAARCGVSIPTVRKVLKEAGVVPHKHTVETAHAEPVAEPLPVLTPYMRGRLLDVWDSSHDLERAARSIMVGVGEAKALLEAEGRSVR